MARRMIGVEIGSHTIKLALISGGTIRKMSVEPMPTDLVREGRATSAAALADFLKGMMKRSGIRGGACALVLPRALVIAHHVTMPRMSDPELRLNLPFEFRDFVGRDASKYDYDYAVLDIRDNTMELYAAAVPRDAVEEYGAILRRAGLKLKIATPAEMAWANLIRHNPGLPRKLCIVDVGHQSTRVNIFAEGNFVMGKDIDIAGAFFDETIAKAQQVDIHTARKQKECDLQQAREALEEACRALAVEVVKILNFYGYTDPSRESPLEHLYCGGGASVIEPLQTALHSSTGLTIHPISRLTEPEDAQNHPALYCLSAAGAALQQEQGVRK